MTPNHASSLDLPRKQSDGRLTDLKSTYRLRRTTVRTVRTVPSRPLMLVRDGQQSGPRSEWPAHLGASVHYGRLPWGARLCLRYWMSECIIQTLVLLYLLSIPGCLLVICKLLCTTGGHNLPVHGAV